MSIKETLAQTDTILAKEGKQFRWQTLFLIFFVGCVVGWVYEEFFYYFTENWVGNRGFLYGPYLPVYGSGSVLMVVLLTKVRSNPLLLFGLAMLVTGVLEYFTGLIMWQVWQQRWWDYTGLFLNIGGFVCLRSVLTFGLGGWALLYGLEPLTVRFTQWLSPQKRRVLCLALIGIMTVDLALTLLLRHPIG